MLAVEPVVSVSALIYVAITFLVVSAVATAAVIVSELRAARQRRATRRLV